MIIKQYENAEIFLRNYESILLEKEAVSQTLLYEAGKSRDVLESSVSRYGAVLHLDEVHLLFTVTKSGELILYCVRLDREEEASAVLAGYLGNAHILISGLSGKPLVCRHFIEHYSSYVKATFLRGLETEIMELRQVNGIRPVPGHQRLALPEEAKLTADWLIRFQIEAMIDETDYEEALSRAKRLIDRGELYLYENVEKQAVSMAAVSRKLVHGIVVTYVFTPEEHRGNGYAAANIYYLSKALLEQGYDFCTLFADKRNLLSNRAYEKVGYKVLEDYCEYKVLSCKEEDG